MYSFFKGKGPPHAFPKLFSESTKVILLIPGVFVAIASIKYRSNSSLSSITQFAVLIAVSKVE